MLKVRDIPKVRLHIAHMAYDRIGDAVALLPVFDADGIIHHFLKMAPVLRDVKGGTFGVVLKVLY